MITKKSVKNLIILLLFLGMLVTLCATLLMGVSIKSAGAYVEKTLIINYNEVASSGSAINSYSFTADELKTELDTAEMTGYSFETYAENAGKIYYDYGSSAVTFGATSGKLTILLSRIGVDYVRVKFEKGGTTVEYRIKVDVRASIPTGMTEKLIDFSSGAESANFTVSVGTYIYVDFMNDNQPTVKNHIGLKKVLADHGIRETKANGVSPSSHKGLNLKNVALAEASSSVATIDPAKINYGNITNPNENKTMGFELVLHSTGSDTITLKVIIGDIGSENGVLLTLVFPTENALNESSSIEFLGIHEIKQKVNLAIDAPNGLGSSAEEIPFLRFSDLISNPKSVEAYAEGTNESLSSKYDTTLCAIAFVQESGKNIGIRITPLVNGITMLNIGVTVNVGNSSRTHSLCLPIEIKGVYKIEQVVANSNGKSSYSISDAYFKQIYNDGYVFNKVLSVDKENIAEVKIDRGNLVVIGKSTGKINISVELYNPIDTLNPTVKVIIPVSVNDIGSIGVFTATGFWVTMSIGVFFAILLLMLIVVMIMRKKKMLEVENKFVVLAENKLQFKKEVNDVKMINKQYEQMKLMQEKQREAQQLALNGGNPQQAGNNYTALGVGGNQGQGQTVMGLNSGTGANATQSEVKQNLAIQTQAEQIAENPMEALKKVQEETQKKMVEEQAKFMDEQRKQMDEMLKAEQDKLRLEREKIEQEKEKFIHETKAEIKKTISENSFETDIEKAKNAGAEAMYKSLKRIECDILCQNLFDYNMLLIETDKLLLAKDVQKYHYEKQVKKYNNLLNQEQDQQKIAEYNKNIEDCTSKLSEVENSISNVESQGAKFQQENDILLKNIQDIIDECGFIDLKQQTTEKIKAYSSDVESQYNVFKATFPKVVEETEGLDEVAKIIDKIDVGYLRISQERPQAFIDKKIEMLSDLIIEADNTVEVKQITVVEGKVLGFENAVETHDQNKYVDDKLDDVTEAIAKNRERLQSNYEQKEFANAQPNDSVLISKLNVIQALRNEAETAQSVKTLDKVESKLEGFIFSLDGLQENPTIANAVEGLKVFIISMKEMLAEQEAQESELEALQKEENERIMREKELLEQKQEEERKDAERLKENELIELNKAWIDIAWQINEGNKNIFVSEYNKERMLNEVAVLNSAFETTADENQKHIIGEKIAEYRENISILENQLNAINSAKEEMEQNQSIFAEQSENILDEFNLQSTAKECNFARELAIRDIATDYQKFIIDYQNDVTRQDAMSEAHKIQVQMEQQAENAKLEALNAVLKAKLMSLEFIDKSIEKCSTLDEIIDEEVNLKDFEVSLSDNERVDEIIDKIKQMEGKIVDKKQAIKESQFKQESLNKQAENEKLEMVLTAKLQSLDLIEKAIEKCITVEQVEDEAISLKDIETNLSVEESNPIILQRIEKIKEEIEVKKDRIIKGDIEKQSLEKEQEEQRLKAEKKQRDEEERLKNAIMAKRKELVQIKNAIPAIKTREDAMKIKQQLDEFVIGLPDELRVPDLLIPISKLKSSLKNALSIISIKAQSKKKIITKTITNKVANPAKKTGTKSADGKSAKSGSTSKTSSVKGVAKSPTKTIKKGTSGVAKKGVTKKK